MVGDKMLRRKIDNYLLNWKSKNHKKPLIISGARQIGKTTSIREFGKTYESFIEINFINEKKYESVVNKLTILKQRTNINFINYYVKEIRLL